MIKFKDVTEVKPDIHINTLLKKVLNYGHLTHIPMETSVELLLLVYIMPVKLYSKTKVLDMLKEMMFKP